MPHVAGAVKSALCNVRKCGELIRCLTMINKRSLVARLEISSLTLKVRFKVLIWEKGKKVLCKARLIYFWYLANKFAFICSVLNKNRAF